jgi:hypothetical protein
VLGTVVGIEAMGARVRGWIITWDVLYIIKQCSYKGSKNLEEQCKDDGSLNRGKFNEKANKYWSR